MTRNGRKVCKEKRCERQAHALGLCSQHYREHRKKRMSPCEAPGCGERSYSGGLCAKHYTRKHRHGDINTVLRSQERRGCEVPGCDRPHKAHGLCQKHYDYCRYHGVEPTVAAVYAREVGKAHETLERYGRSA